MTVSQHITGRVLVLGGARSGKSTYAEGRLAGPGPVDYVATSLRVPGDAEWDVRIARHRARRPAHWTTIETLDVAGELVKATDRPVLVDCLTVWLTRQMDQAGAWDGRPGADDRLATAIDQLVGAFGAARRPVVVVSNEVGQGIVPAQPSVRRFRDEMGILNMRVAGVADEVWFCIAGLPQRLR